ncbi:MAG: aldehyde dehydrogenase family protein, partial [Saprospiraceae bacterium]|nr:aldehyde dehydrogenase family protein [Saprospiraceae bacterium]
PSVGKIVMKAAANHLASVTLELGGKSPTIIDDTASIKSAAKRIAWGKFFNCGQICIAPDYVFIHESKLDEFVAALQKVINTFFGENPYDSDSFSLVVNKKHTERIANYLEQSILSGAKVLIGGHYDKDKNYLQPTVVSQVGFDSALMTNEIFGPVLPIITFKTLDEVVDTINQKEKPLALYIYSNSTKNTKFVLDNTRAGGTCINNNDVHFFNSNLPFGGANNSGIGKSHGHFGFLAFSEPRGVYKQHFPGALELLMPPYNKFKEKLIELTVKYF